MTVMIGGRECVRGIDVAMYQPSIDYGVVKTVRDFAYIKASEGTSYKDPKFTQHFNGFRSIGMPLGAYHYLQTGDGRTQAQNFLRVTNNYQGFNLPVAVDYEQSGVTSGIANAFIAEIERVIGKPWVGPTGQPVACVIYTGNYFNPRDRSADWNRMDMWLAAYTNKNYPNPGPEPQYLPVPGASWPWNAWSIWQCNGGDGRCPGVGGGQTQCDQNVATVEWFNRTLGHQAGDWFDMATKEELQEIVNNAVATLAGFEQDTRTVVIDGVEQAVAPNIVEAGWASRTYPFKFDDNDAVFYHVDEGIRWIKNGADLSFLTRTKLNPHVQVFPASAKADILKNHPIVGEKPAGF